MNNKIILRSTLYVIFICITLLVSCTSRSGKRKNGVYSSQPNNTTTNTTNNNTVKVIKIVDGDTYDLLTEDKTTIRIRMNGIDAPERGQPFYQKAKDFLGQLCFQKNIRIVKIDIDMHGRVIADSYLDDGTSLSYEMVRNGFAWHFKKYSNDTKLAQLEIDAKSMKLGLWVDENPTAPWDIRAHRRNGKKDNEE